MYELELEFLNNNADIIEMPKFELLETKAKEWARVLGHDDKKFWATCVAILQDPEVNIDIFAGLKRIPSDYLYDVKSIDKIVLPSNVEIVGHQAFVRSSLQSIEMPNVTIIEDSAFYGCNQLSNIKFSDRLSKIGYMAFTGCQNLHNIIFPKSLEDIGDRAFAESGITSIDIPTKINKIFPYTFASCHQLMHVELNEGLTRIYRNVFANCEKLKEIILPASLELLDYYAFLGCTALTKVTFLGATTEITNSAFEGATNIETFYCHSNSPAEKYAKEHDINIQYI